MGNFDFIVMNMKDVEDAFSGRNNIFEKFKEWEMINNELKENEIQNEMVEHEKWTQEEDKRIKKEYEDLMIEMDELEKYTNDILLLLGKERRSTEPTNDEDNIMRAMERGDGDTFGY